MAIDRHHGAGERGTQGTRREASSLGSKKRAKLAAVFGAALVSALWALASCTAPTSPDELFNNTPSGQGGGASSSSTSTSGSSSSNSSTSSSGSTSSSSSGSTSSSSGSSSSGMPGAVAICINELMPINQSALVDDLGNTPDWIELHNPSNMAVNLEGWSLTNDLANPQMSVLPAGLTLPAGGFLVLYADGNQGAGPLHLSFNISGNGGVVGLFDPNGGSTSLTYMAAQANEAIARKPDCCMGDACAVTEILGTPAKTNVPVPTQIVEVLPAGSTFKYLDTGVAPAATWIDAGFNDSAWMSGPAPLGYGDAHIVTTVSFGPSGNNKYITTWFRTTFNVTGAASVISAGLELLRDDGALVYVNGTEVVRDNLPAGAITPTTLATGLVQGGEETIYVPYTLDPALLVEGMNTLAVELHQQVANTSDAGMDVRVTVELPMP